jgi:hypothetical protein
MSPEEIEALNADPVEEAIVEDIEEATDDIDELSEALAVHSIISEERHDEILERVDECRTQLATLSSVPTAENPILTQLLNQMIELRTELATLKSSMELRSNPAPTQNESETPTPVENPEETRTEPSPKEEAENPVPEVKKKNRFV